MTAPGCPLHRVQLTLCRKQILCRTSISSHEDGDCQLQVFQHAAMESIKIGLILLPQREAPFGLATCGISQSTFDDVPSMTEVDSKIE